MDRPYEADTMATAPSMPPNLPNGFPSDGDPNAGRLATEPGAYWFHAVNEEIRNVITGGGLTPDNGELNQMLLAIQAMIRQTNQENIDAVRPVGSLFISTVDTNPSQYFPGTTWERYGQGRVLLSAQDSGTYKGGNTGGAETVTLSVDNLPSHSHGASCSSAGAHTHTAESNGAHTHTAQSAGAHTHTTTSAGAHTHARGTMNITGQFPTSSDLNDSHDSNFKGAFSRGGNGTGRWAGDHDDSVRIIKFTASSGWSGATSSSGAHSHTANSAGAHTHTTTSNGAHTHTTTSNGAHAHTVSVGNTGNGKAFNNMGPWVAVYVFRRTA